MENEKLTLKEIEKRLSKMPKQEELKFLSDADLDKTLLEIKSLKSRKDEIQNFMEERKKLEEKVLKHGNVIFRIGENGEVDDMRDQTKRKNNVELEFGALQKFITNQNMGEEERSLLTTVGASAVIPSNVLNDLLKSDKYSDLLRRATVIRGADYTGKTTIPLIKKVKAAIWKQEGATVAAENSPIEGIELKGYELMRLMTISSSTQALSVNQFGDMMLDLLSEEVLETLEESFITGTGVEQSTGLDTMEMEENTVEAVESITVKDVASAISKLPNKYARNAIVMGNAQTLYELSLLVSENDKTLATGADSFLKKEIVPNEHISNDVIYVVDPAQLYVKFSSDISVSSDTSRGFREATIDLRALTVVDAKWNPHAVSKVVIKS